MTAPLLGIALWVVAGSLASMTAAIERGDVDDAARRGQLAGPTVVERAVAARDRSTRTAGIAAATAVEGRVELLDALASAASGPDRRTSLPAATAAAAIAAELERQAQRDALGDDHAAADIVGWRDRWVAVALDQERPVDVRVRAVETAARLEVVAIALGADAAASRIGVPLAALAQEPDPDVRVAVVSAAPQPLPASLRADLVSIVVRDTDDVVAVTAAQALCADLVADPAEPILAALGDAGLARLRSAITSSSIPRGALRDAARCLTADPDPASAAALRAIRTKLR